MVPALSVVELPTYHQMVDPLTPLFSAIVLLTAVATVDEGACNTQTASASPRPSRVRALDTSIDALAADI